MQIGFIFIINRILQMIIKELIKWLVMFQNYLSLVVQNKVIN